jgi:putative NADH-flavin reductase
MNEDFEINTPDITDVMPVYDDTDTSDDVSDMDKAFPSVDSMDAVDEERSDNMISAMSGLSESDSFMGNSSEDEKSEDENNTVAEPPKSKTALYAINFGGDSSSMIYRNEMQAKSNHDGGSSTQDGTEAGTDSAPSGKKSLREHLLENWNFLLKYSPAFVEFLDSIKKTNIEHGVALDDEAMKNQLVKDVLQFASTGDGWLYALIDDARKEALKEEDKLAKAEEEKKAAFLRMQERLKLSMEHSAAQVQKVSSDYGMPAHLSDSLPAEQQVVEYKKEMQDSVQQLQPVSDSASGNVNSDESETSDKIPVMESGVSGSVVQTQEHNNDVFEGESSADNSNPVDAILSAPPVPASSVSPSVVKEQHTATVEQIELGDQRFMAQLEKISSINAEMGNLLIDVKDVNLNMVDLLTKIGNASEHMRDEYQKINSISVSMDEQISKANRFFSKSYSDNITKNCERILANYIEQSKSQYIDLFNLATRNYRIFSDAVIKFQKGIELQLSEQFKIMLYLIYCIPVLLLINIGLLVYIIFFR